MTINEQRILVVDDNPSNRRLLEAMLESSQYRVITVEDGPTALAIADREPVDLVLLDWQMPGLDGFEVCRRLRAQPATATLPIVMVTASGKDAKVAALDVGADDFLARPFDQAELLARVRSLLRMKRYHDALQGQAAELAAWNRTLEQRVAEQLDEVQRLQGLRRFLSARVADLVVGGGNEALLEPHRREVAVLFCDLRGFTPFSVAAEPEEVVGAIKEFHRIADGLIARYGGTVGPFAGDGLMVVFNDPVPCDAPALQAVSMAVDLRDAMVEFGSSWKRRGHCLSAGISVTFGYATMGVLGLADRADYMALGPVVNLASRLCDAAGCGEILVSQRVITELGGAVDATDRGEMELRGFPTLQPVFAVTGLRRDAPPTAPDPRGIEFNLLGPLEVRNGWTTVEIRAARERELLSLLLIHRGRTVSVDRLADQLWDGEPPGSGVAALRVQVSRLRKSLASHGLGDLLVTKPNGYLLAVDDEYVDAVRFERQCESARRSYEAGDAAAAAEQLRFALRLWRGPALADVGDAGFAAVEAHRLEESRLTAIEDCFETELAAGRHREVLAEVESTVAEHPLRERLWRFLLIALHRSGRQADALAAYQSLRRRLADELGLEPSPELADLHQAILTGGDVGALAS
ncbi:MAG TPA: BTAD domain-containing putative transcriptional regulator [Mycobacteriales bacterium]|nr:BTAD domain-containing putative transcriptional regulator [Mycobacteriales bacterium]